MEKLNIRLFDLEEITVEDNGFGNFTVNQGDRSAICNFKFPYNESALKDRFILYIYSAIERWEKNLEDFFETVNQHHWYDCCTAKSNLEKNMGWNWYDLEAIYDYFAKQEVKSEISKVKTNV